MAQEYWVRHQDKLTGPFSGQQLKQMAAAAMVMATDMISTDQINWRVAGHVKELFQEGQLAEDNGIDSSASLAATENDHGVTDAMQEIHSKEKPSVKPAQFGVLPRPESTANGPKKAAVSPPSPTTPDSIPRRVKRTYTCPNCTQRVEAVYGGVIGCLGTPRFKISFFTAAETMECPVCYTKVLFPMTKFRFCVYATAWFGGVLGLTFAIAGKSHFGIPSLMVFGFFTCVLIRDIAMRQRR